MPIRGSESSIFHTTSGSREQTMRSTCCQCKPIWNDLHKAPCHSCLCSCWLLFMRNLFSSIKYILCVLYYLMKVIRSPYLRIFKINVKLTTAAALSTQLLAVRNKPWGVPAVSASPFEPILTKSVAILVLAIACSCHKKFVFILVQSFNCWLGRNFTG